MKRTALVALLLIFSFLTCLAQDYTWSSAEMDGSRTGCTAPSRDNIKEAIGYFKGSTYVAPSGKKYSANSSTAKVARLVLDAQPKMARVKEVVGYSPEYMGKTYPEGPLSNWFIDILKEKVEELAGKEVHIAVGNSGGIRVDMPQGEVLLDDMLSMFPFKNQLVYVEQTGREIRKVLEEMAATRFQPLAGVRVVASEGKLVSVEIAGEPLDDEKVYGLATISFLLNGGDNLFLARNAVEVITYDVDVIDAVLEHVYAEKEAGRPLVSKSDGRVVIK